VKIRQHAAENEIDAALVAAIVFRESEGRAGAMRFERLNQNFDSVEKYAAQNRITVWTEKTLQSFSYGLMQLMGFCLREEGHKGMLPEALDPDLNLHLGCRKLKRYVVKYPQVTDVIHSWNRGGPYKTVIGKYENQAYVDAVLAYKRDIENYLALTPS
jgi:soluble lytic murein transglycosylase-like protein